MGNHFFFLLLPIQPMPNPANLKRNSYSVLLTPFFFSHAITFSFPLIYRTWQIWEYLLVSWKKGTWDSCGLFALLLKVRGLIFSPTTGPHFWLGILISASQTWLILSISWDLSLELYVPEVRVGLTTALGMNLKPIDFICPLSTAHSSLNCKVLEMGGKITHFWPSPILHNISSCLASYDGIH